jgi:hypothetical protein
VLCVNCCDLFFMFTHFVEQGFAGSAAFFFEFLEESRCFFFLTSESTYFHRYSVIASTSLTLSADVHLILSILLPLPAKGETRSLAP